MGTQAWQVAKLAVKPPTNVLHGKHQQTAVQTEEFCMVAANIRDVALT
jgi:hypothetical protein